VLVGFLERALFLGLQTATFLLYPHMVEGRRGKAEEGERGRGKGGREKERERKTLCSLLIRTPITSQGPYPGDFI